MWRKEQKKCSERRLYLTLERPLFRSPYLPNSDRVKLTSMRLSDRDKPSAGGIQDGLTTDAQVAPIHNP